ncbi:MAG: PQQ-dependent sugar dehydrogenase [Desulfobacterales bacterium]
MKAVSSLALTIIFLAFGSTRLPAQPHVTQGDVPAERGFRAVTLLQGLEHPWGITWLPNGDTLVTERPGRLRLVREDRLVSNPIPGVPEVFDSGQGGLLDVSLHPRFEKNRKVYFTYAYGTSKANRTRVAAAVWDGAVLANWQVIFEVTVAKPGSQHFGSRLMWLPDGTLLVSIGDGGNPPVRLGGDWIRNQAQNRRSHLGKIVRLNDDGSIPRDNPFSASADAEPAVWSSGHRNVQGLAYDSLRDMVWASEHGALGGDELNVVQAGLNYGWPAVSYSREYFDGSKVSPYTSKPGLVDPKVVWTTAIAPSGLVVYTGNRFPEWHGDVFAGGLKSQDVRRLDLDADGRVIGQSALRIGQRVRDVRQGPDGLLYVITDESNGSLIRLEPATDKELPDAP